MRENGNGAGHVGMLKNFKELLSDDTGRLSTGRVMALLTLLSALAVLAVAVTTRQDLTQLILGLVGTAFSGKTLQSIAER